MLLRAVNVVQAAAPAAARRTPHLLVSNCHCMSGSHHDEDFIRWLAVRDATAQQYSAKQAAAAEATRHQRERARAAVAEKAALAQRYAYWRTTAPAVPRGPPEPGRVQGGPDSVSRKG